MVMKKKPPYIVKIFCADPGCCRLVTVELTDGPLREPLCENCREAPAEITPPVPAV